MYASACLIVWLSLLLFVVPAYAGMEGQPCLSEEIALRLKSVVQQFQEEHGDRNKARPDLILLVEQNPAADLTDILAPALSDDTVYQSLTLTFADALDSLAQGDARRPFLIYNLGRTHLLRARALSDSRLRRPYLDVAARTTAKFDANLRDAAVWELRGDIEAERGNLEAAIAAYQKISLTPGKAAYAQYRIATALHNARRWTAAEAAYQRAAQTETTRGQLLHLIYQGLVGVYLEKGDYASAVNALTRSARVKQSETAPYRLRLDRARVLLQRGYRNEVAAYAQAAVKFAPDDAEAIALRNQASQQSR